MYSNAVFQSLILFVMGKISFIALPKCSQHFKVCGGGEGGSLQLCPYVLFTVKPEWAIDA